MDMFGVVRSKKTSGYIPGSEGLMHGFEGVREWWTGSAWSQKESDAWGSAIPAEARALADRLRPPPSVDGTYIRAVRLYRPKEARP